MYVKWNAEGIGPVVAKCFPENRKDIKVETFKGPKNVNSYWDEGSKSVYFLINLVTMEELPLPTSHPVFDRKPNGERMGNLELNELPENVALVEGGWFCGKPSTVYVYLRPENFTKFIPGKVELPPRELSALNAIAGLKGGKYRQEEFDRRGLGAYNSDNPLIKALAEKGLVKITKVGISVTTEGRNAR